MANNNLLNLPAKAIGFVFNAEISIHYLCNIKYILLLGLIISKGPFLVVDTGN